MRPVAGAGLTLDEIVARFGGRLLGDGGIRIVAVGTLDRARGDQITFLANPRYRSKLSATHAGAVVVADEEGISRFARIVTDNPYLYFARVAQALHPLPAPIPGVHPSAVVENSAVVSPSASIAALAYVGADVKLGDGVSVGAGACVGAGCTVGPDSVLHPKVVIYPGCQLGSRVTLHSGVVIGADGFGLANDRGSWVKIPQTGRVVIGDDVEIGANTTVDRGAIEDTVIEEGVKLDNQIQVGHNVFIGAHSAIAGCVGIAGSARIGRHCTIGGAAGILGHLEICDHASISAFSLVTKSIKTPAMYSAAPPLMEHRAWLANAVHMRHLDRMAERLRNLEQELMKLKRGPP
jgi:UDP-3-O-[3-hydroxymyristoyl] glucosamine N-acyltransferase